MTFPFRKTLLSATVSLAALLAGNAALAQEAPSLRGRKAGVILSGQNVDLPLFAEVLSGRTPRAA